jgi:hypothetical protein
MKVSSVVLCACVFLSSALKASENLERARQLEKSGDVAAARDLLSKGAKNGGATAEVELAEFLDSYGDPGAREAYRAAETALRQKGDTAAADRAARRIKELELFNAKANQPAKSEPDRAQYVEIPGPIRSFSRMAALSLESTPDEVLAALARNVVTNGYQASHSNDALEQTEYLKLVHRYISQARELEKLAGPEKVIRIENCEAANAGELLRVLGFRMRGGCGSEVVLETVNATRAFLTTDSGFPIAELEQALRTNRPFTYDYRPARVSVLFGPDYWLSAKEKGSDEFIDAFMGDPMLCRMYLGLAKLDPETAEELRKNIPPARLRAFSHVLDFFGGMFEIRDHKAVVPGAARAAATWGELAGAPPEQGAAFFEKLLLRDDGWLASLFDAVSRIEGPVRDYLVEPARLKRFYAAIRGKVTSPGPARPVFRSNADMMLLTTRLRLDDNGKPHIPGDVEVWKNLFIEHPHGKYDGKLTKSAAGWKDADDVLEALFALCRKAVENEPLKIFMVLSDLDRNRAKPLEAATVDRLAREYRLFGAQYSVFNEAPSVSDASIIRFLDTARAVSKMRDPQLRADSAGTMQGLVGLWQIFSRQGTLPAGQADASLAGILTPFAEIRSDRELFDAGRNGVKLLLAATGSSSPANPQDRLVDLLAGAPNPSDVDAHTQLVQEMVRVLEAQKIISLNTIFDIADHLQEIGSGTKLNTALINRMQTRIAEIQLPRAALSGVEKTTLAFGFYTEKHVDSERKVNLRAAIDRAGGDAQKLKDLRGLLAPFLRDALVAYNYAHYAPPGAQVLFTNPLFVRGHDFIGVQGTNHTWKATELFGSGWPSNGGGRLIGSLTGLPYALAEAEQNFLVPSQTQALIWGDLVPQMILSAKIPRWWNVTPAQVHWVGLHMRYGQALLAQSALDPGTRDKFLTAFARQASPARVMAVRHLLEQGAVRSAYDRVTPSELFVVASDVATKEKDDACMLAVEIRRLAADAPDEVAPRAISRAFGTPKPTLTSSYRPELLHLRTFPTLMGYSSRIMAESWESNTLYWVALADEMNLPPSALNVRIPEWTQKLVERIFASHLEDWPALLRSLRTVGEDIRAELRPQKAGEQASLQ